MPVFEYKAINEFGKTVTGTMDAENAGIIQDYLDAQNFMPVKIKEKKSSNFEINLFSKKKKIKQEEIVNFTKQLVTLLKAGVPIISSLEAISEQAENPEFKNVLTQVHDSVERGSSFSDSLAQHPAVFYDLYTNSVRAGETGGVLDQVLERIGSLMSYEAETKKKVKSAMRYPIFVISAIVVGFSVLMAFVVPKFISIFKEAKAELPLPTKILLAISYVFQHYILYMAIGMVLLIVAFRYYTSTEKGKYQWHYVMLKMPVFGNLLTKTAMSRFTHMFETLNRSGLPILQTMSIISKTVGNVVIESEVLKIAQGIEKGKGISKPLSECSLFPPLVVKMVAVGEQSGSLDEMLKNVSEHYDTEVEYALEGLVSAIEPILTITIGALILLLALGIFMPMWNMTEVMGQ